MTKPIKFYGGKDTSMTRVDISQVEAVSVDLRAETGAGAHVPDETCVMPAGTFALSVMEPDPNDWPIGEIRIWYRDREIRIVGALTGRPGIVEVTPDHLLGAFHDPNYRGTIRQWLGLAA